MGKKFEGSTVGEVLGGKEKYADKSHALRASMLTQWHYSDGNIETFLENCISNIEKLPIGLRIASMNALSIIMVDNGVLTPLPKSILDKMYRTSIYKTRWNIHIIDGEGNLTKVYHYRM